MKKKILYNSLFKKYDCLALSDAIETLALLQIELTKYLRRSVFVRDPIQLDIDDVTPIVVEDESKEYFAKKEVISYKDREEIRQKLVETDLAIDELKVYFGFEGSSLWRLKEKLKKKKEKKVDYLPKN
ncbi:MAG: hypothetical protein LBV55_03955 [Acholeplasmatales bacterium]|jgi:hypothetical protein|nr:hypothetical protein [Acholeplasmatales bacterium]